MADLKKIIPFIVIVVSEDTLIFGTNINPLFTNIRFLIYAILLVFYFNNIWKCLDKKVFYLTICITISFFVTMVLNNDFRNGYFSQLLIIFFALKISNKIEFDFFLDRFGKILYFLSISSLVFYAIVCIIPPVLNVLPVISNYGNVEFATVLVSNIMKHEGILRNSGIFREPGVFGVYLVIGLLYQLFYLDKLNIKYIIVFLITLITTFSTSAFFAIPLLMLGYIYQTKSVKAKLNVFIVIGVFIIIVLPFVYEIVFSKLDADTAGYRSTLSRIASVSIPMAMFQDHLTGVGLSNFVDLYPTYSLLLFDLEFKPEGEATNTFVNTFAIYGICYGVILLYAIWSLARKSKKSQIICLIIFAAYILLFSSQELRFSLLFNVFVMYGLALPVLKKTSEINN